MDEPKRDRSAGQIGGAANGTEEESDLEAEMPHSTDADRRLI